MKLFTAIFVLVCASACTQIDALRASLADDGCGPDAFTSHQRAMCAPLGPLDRIVDGDILIRGKPSLQTFLGLRENRRLFSWVTLAVPLVGDDSTGDNPQVRKWPGGVIPFRVGENMPPDLRTQIVRAMKLLTTSTLLRFIPAAAADVSFVVFQPTRESNQCLSSLGMQPDGQSIILGNSCTATDVMHEILHAAGLGHEHCRRDRDLYVQIHYENIQPGLESRYVKYVTDYMMTRIYDFKSIMHYHANTSARIVSDELRSSEVVMTRLDGSTDVGPGDTLSEMDARELNSTAWYPE